MKYIIKLLVLLACALCLPLLAFAETHVSEDTSFVNGAAWTKEGSPYILDTDVNLTGGENLYIGPGVTVTSPSGTDPSLLPSLFIGSGSLTIDGTADESVVFDNVDAIYLPHSSSSIYHAVLNMPNGIIMTHSTTTIDSSTITGANNAINARASSVVISNSVLTDNDYGVYSYFMPKGPVLSDAGDCLLDNPTKNCGQNMGGDGNALPDDPTQNHIAISGSVIYGNHKFGVYNATSNTINAENNWWGGIDGPRSDISTSSIITMLSTSTDYIHGVVDVVPWLTVDPRLKATSTICCSNVLFIPGIEASRLYLDQKGGIGAPLSTTTIKLWEPIFNDDVRTLFLDNNGKSINPNIYTKDVVDSAFGLGVYKNFIAMMNSVVADGKVQSWEAFPYDWRQSIDSIINRSILSDIQSLASTSKTHKVTIVAHSNGGLVAKALMRTLQGLGEASLVDKVILVAVPELGTPQAVAGLLHGDDQSILGGLILKQGVARQLGQNAPGAYGLLPSKAYFGNLLAPIISFASSTLAGIDFSKYGQTVSSYDSLRSFMASILDNRPNPFPDDTQSPNTLHISMIDAAQRIHDSIDSFIFPSSTPAISLIGWGKMTLDGIKYFMKNGSIAYSASTTPLGDGTVVTASAVSTDSSNYYMNLRSSNHATILNNDLAVNFVKDAIVSPNKDPLLNISPDITNKAPTLADYHADNLVVTIHSPVELNLYDSQGRHTGPIPNPNPGSDIGMFETGIPDSDYTPRGDEISVTVPDNDNYRVVLNGIGTGTFTLDTEHDINGGAVSTSTFVDLPVTPLLKAELDLTPTTSTSSQVLMLDNDGNGIVDATSSPHSTPDLATYFQSMRGVILSLHLTAFKEKIELNKIDKILELLKKGKTLKADEKAEKAIKSIENEHWIFRNLDDTKKQALIGIFDSILDAFAGN